MHEKETVHDDEERAEQVHELARQFTRLSRAQTTHSVVNQNPFELDGSHPEIDPASPKFNMRTWIKTLVHHYQRESHPSRSAGVSFRNLAVHGFGAPTDYQKVINHPRVVSPAHRHAIRT